MKKTGIIIAAAGLLLLAHAGAAGLVPSVVVNNKKLDCEVILKDDRVYVPLRAVSESMGADVSWNGDTYTATVNLSEGDNDLSGIIAEVSESVVAIVGNYKDKSHTGTAHGSGVVIKSGGEILTNAHVVKDLEQIIVVMNDGSGYEGKLKYIDEDIDLAVVKINKIGLTPVRFADMGTVVTGKTVVAIGTPVSFSFRNSASKGIVSGISGSSTSNYRLIQTDAAINPGNSGGPLVNTAGELVGINSSKFVSSYIEGMGFAIPVDTVKYTLSQFDTYGKVRKIDTGITYDESWAASLGLPTYDGLTVRLIKRGSAAEAAGIKSGDIIAKIGEAYIHSNVDFNEVMKNYNIGDTMKFTIVRNGGMIETDVTATEK